MHDETRTPGRLADWAAGLWGALREYFGSIGRRRSAPIDGRGALREFLETRASFVAQTSLYGYLRTRAGMVYPQLFDNDAFVRSINIAKWHVWLACLSDLSVYAGGLLMQHPRATRLEVGSFMRRLVAEILDDTGRPADADEHFTAHAKRVRARLEACDWDRVADDETPFSESPTALVRHAPVLENLKELDEEIVRNSIRFRWQEIRRDLRQNLNADTVLQSVMSETIDS